MIVTNLRCEYLTNPLGIDIAQPRLSWELRDGRRGARQSAYQVQVVSGETAPFAGDADLWDTGQVVSDASAHVPYGGPPLRPGRRCYWRVRVWDESGAPSAWSEAAFWEAGLLDSTNWLADWITPL